MCKAWHATARPVHFASAYHAAAMSRATMSHLPASPLYGVNGLRLHLASADTGCSAFTHIPQHVPMQGTTRPRQRGGCVAPSCGMTFFTAAWQNRSGLTREAKSKRCKAVVALLAKGVTRDHAFDMARAELFVAGCMSLLLCAGPHRPVTRFRLDKSALRFVTCPDAAASNRGMHNVGW